jgi:hypothetical protein
LPSLFAIGSSIRDEGNPAFLETRAVEGRELWRMAMRTSLKRQGGKPEYRPGADGSVAQQSPATFRADCKMSSTFNFVSV